MRALHAGPPAQGLYDPRFEHDACGVAFVATLTGDASHDIVDQALTALRNLDHRGAAGAEPNSGDGAGHPAPGARRVPARGRRLRRCPPPARYAVGMAFLPGDADAGRQDPASGSRRSPPRRGSTVLGWRDVPVDPDARSARPPAA